MATAADILGLNRKPPVARRWANHYQSLCAQRDRLLARDCSSPGVASTKMDEMAEAASEEWQRGMTMIAATATQEVLFEVIEAIRRIERGAYGICELTGEPIEAARLRAIPWARYSLRGQDEMERNGFGRKSALPVLEAVTEAAPDEEEAKAEEEEE
jgi:RNA polymerase-binding transcription factor DksA